MLLVHWCLSSPHNSPTCLQLLINSASIHPSLLTEKLRPSLHSGGGGGDTPDRWANPLIRWGKPPVYIISHYNLIGTGGLPHLSGWPHLPGVPHLLASPQTSFGVRLSRIHFSRGREINDKLTPKDVCGEATNLHVNGALRVFAILYHSHCIGFGYCLYSSVYSSWLGNQFIVFMSCYVLHILL